MDFKFETEGPSLVYLLTCIIKRGKGLELSRKGGRWDVGRKSGSGQEEGGVASVIVCMVARAQ